MTIGVGLRCRDGALLGSDQQHTAQGYYKYNAPKIGNIVQGQAILAWTYSGIPNLTNVMRGGLRARLTSASPTSAEIAGAIEAQYRQMRVDYPQEMQTQEFLYAFSGGTDFRLVRASNGVVDEPDWAYIGVGDSSLVNYIGTKFRFIPPPLMSVEEAVALTVFTIDLAKDFVDGVGGPTDLVIVRHSGRIDFFPHRYIEEIETAFPEMIDAFRSVYNICTNAALSDEEVERLIVNLGATIKWIRQARNKRPTP